MRKPYKVGFNVTPAVTITTTEPTVTFRILHISLEIHNTSNPLPYPWGATHLSRAQKYLPAFSMFLLLSCHVLGRLCAQANKSRREPAKLQIHCSYCHRKEKRSESIVPEILLSVINPGHTHYYAQTGICHLVSKASSLEKNSWSLRFKIISQHH